MISVRSCPAQKPRPAPVRRIARQVVSPTASSSAAASAAAISTVSAFNRSGRFSAKYGVDRLVWFEAHESIAAAAKREKQIKEWKRAWKVELIERDNPQWMDLYPSLPP